MIKQQKESLVTVQRTISCRSSWLYFWSHTGNGSGGVRGFTEGPHVPLPGPTAFFIADCSADTRARTAPEPNGLD
jgi:hypothetical protein